jgi:xylulose-5-phosphate/fructose-6-phosphate phosphoketolase
LSSYKPDELFTESGFVTDEVTSILPKDETKRLGQRVEAYRPCTPLSRPNWVDFTVSKGGYESSMQAVGRYLDQIFVRNPHTVRLFSPDELESNKLDTALDHTNRNFQCDQYSNARGGRVIEVLSEHMCQGFMQGYTLTGRTALFPSYESFLGIIHTMMVQYSKFSKIVSKHFRS